MELEKLYWLGNSAKTKIIYEILHALSPLQQPLIFDYGCGTGGDWPAILQDFPNVKLIGYEPHKPSYSLAKNRLAASQAEIFTGDELNNLTFEADYIISFSVFEHVYDREAYLRTAKKHLCETGIFYLAYDDGHFRNILNLNQPERWFGQLKVWLHNVLAAPLASSGYVSVFQKRVHRTDVDRLVAEIGFDSIRVFYSNLLTFKGLMKTVPREQQEVFMQFWLDIERRLNQDFLYEGATEVMGDTANLWQVMGTRTLVLQKSSFSA